jgi:hypothetical protein
VKQSILVLAVAVMLGSAGAGSVAAQTLAADVVPPHETFAIVRSMGLSPLGQPVRRGGLYVLRAGNRHGEVMRVVIDARAGEVVSINPVSGGPDRYVEPGYRPPAGIPGPRSGPYEQGPRVIPADPRYVPRAGPRPAPPPAGYELDDELDEEDVGALPPPRVITAPRFPDVPSARSARVSARVMPAKPPLPRPRPTAMLASGHDVTGSVPTPPARPAQASVAKKPDETTPPMQAFE